ncbi:MAG: DUF3179 domain-containing protein, partial [Desulfobulbia bacterium]
NNLVSTLLLIASTNLFVLAGKVHQTANAESIFSWSQEFPKTQFSKSSVQLSEIKSDGPKRDTIPPINNPRFISVKDIIGIGDLEPVLSVELEGDLRAYPLQILLWHEIVNDRVNNVPILVSYCPLCNSGVVFDRRLEGRTIVFGNTGRIRHFDMVMYDLETESWWQQFVGEAIVGSLTGKKLEIIPARLESLARFRSRGEHGKVLVPNEPTARPYGTSPFAGTDSARVPADRYPYPILEGMNPFDRVVVVGRNAWPLTIVRKKGELKYQDLVITWLPGQNSLHDKRRISEGRDVGNVLVRRNTEKGYIEVAYDITFVFAFSAFVPEGHVHTGSME